MLVGLLFLGLCGAFSAGIQLIPSPRYHNYANLTAILTKLAKDHSNMATLYSIGKSVEGRDLWVLKIQSPKSVPAGTPHVKFIGNIHGNEPVGRELILRFAQYLLENYDKDEEVEWIVDKTIIHLLPSMNPDGFEIAEEGSCQTGPGRQNANHVDLNRSFPDYFVDNPVPMQPETYSVAKWLDDYPFVLSVSFHGGALVANYPFDNVPHQDVEALKEEILKNITRGDNIMEIWMNLSDNERASLSPNESMTPDDDVFKFLATTYSRAHSQMWAGTPCPNSGLAFPGGITNGAAWYNLVGGMQDFNYVRTGCLELTLEISCCKYPKADRLPKIWQDNKKAMFELLKQSQVGVRGLIFDKVTAAPVEKANLTISGRNFPFYSSKSGEFWRILLPGHYTLNVVAKGYESQSFPFTVQPYDATPPTFTWLNIHLQPIFYKAESSNQVSNESPSLLPKIALQIINILFSLLGWHPVIGFILVSVHHAGMKAVPLKKHVGIT